MRIFPAEQTLMLQNGRRRIEVKTLEPIAGRTQSVLTGNGTMHLQNKKSEHSCS